MERHEIQLKDEVQHRENFGALQQNKMKNEKRKMKNEKWSMKYEIWKMKNQKSEMRTVQILFIIHFWLQFPTQLFSRDKCCKVIITLLWHLTHPRSTNWLKKINWLVDLEMNCTISFNITRRKLDSYRYAHPRAPKIVNDRS